VKEGRGRVEDLQQDEEGREVVERAHGTDGDHEPPDESHVPAVRPAYEAPIDVVRGDRDLGEVVEKVVQQDLHREHRQERQEQSASRHAEHVAEARAGSHEEIFHDVPERPSAFEDPDAEDLESRLEEDDLGRFLRHIDGAGDGDADVRRVERRCIVDPVTDVTDDVPSGTERLQHPAFLSGVEARKHVRPLCPMSQRGIGQPVDVATKEEVLRRDPDSVADVTGDELAVPGEHLNDDSFLSERMNDGSRVVARRIDERQKSRQGQLAFVVARETTVLRHRRVGDSEHTVTGLAELSKRGLAPSSRLCIERPRNSVDLVGGRDGEDVLGRSFRHDDGLTITLRNDAHAAALEVEGDLVDLRESGDVGVVVP